ncbi:hypothetical protein O181_056771 [Austropuccinia psidii MF-1]|uniref:Uncharacterized protein n=1 Tax=Austropuccinia psidii MF-1 TaxID=1389203 RepID=A0A9Q3EDV7_9BASI|nr:hypothetical protein [Austropuccinia psidii MF-1]
MIFWKQEGEPQFEKVLHLFDLECPDLHQGPVALVHPIKNVEPNSNELGELCLFLISWELNPLEPAHRQCYIPTHSRHFRALCVCEPPSLGLRVPPCHPPCPSVNKLLAMETYEFMS